jgi:GTPase SAR1 family protein
MLKQHNDPDIPVILLGNKIDTINEEEREIVREAAIRFVKEYNLSSYYFCSAKTGEGLSSPFAHLGILIIEDHKKKNPK